MNNFVFAIPYLLIVVTLFCLFIAEIKYYKHKPSKRIIQRIAFVILLVFIGLRGFIYSDWYSYYPEFNYMPSLWHNNLAEIIKYISNMQYEPLFSGYSILVKSIYPSYFFWVFVNTLIDFLVLSKFFKKHTNNYVFAWLFFFAMNGLFIEFNLFRNAKAIILFIISLKFLKERKPIAYFSINIIGVLFHASALIFLPLYFILNKKIPKIILWLIFIFGNIIFLNQIGWIEKISDSLLLINFLSIGEKILLYSSTENNFGISIGYIERILTFILIMIFRKKLLIKDSSNNIFINTYICYFISIFYLHEFSVFAERLSVLFIFSYWIIYPKIYSIISRPLNRKIFIFTCMIFIMLKVTVANLNPLAKYDNILFGIESYDKRWSTFKKNIE